MKDSRYIAFLDALFRTPSVFSLVVAEFVFTRFKDYTVLPLSNCQDLERVDNLHHFTPSLVGGGDTSQLHPLSNC